MTLLFLLYMGCIFSISVGELPTTEDYPNMNMLDDVGNMILYWNVNETHIKFEIHGNTSGWVGIGISPRTDMIGADIMVGWVSNGTGIVTDRHGTDNKLPPKDPKQNVQLLNAAETDGWTMIKFQRPILSDETGYDLTISTGLLNVIYAFGDNDPLDEDIADVDYHKNNRGLKQVAFLAENESSSTASPIEDDLPPTENFTHSAVMDMDANVKLYWAFNDTFITFEIHARTSGWVGMGISPNGGMIGADIAVGWVKEGVASITDRHGNDNGFPPKDLQQNLELLIGVENNGWTVIKFRRQLAACEPEYDLPITGDTLKIIYAFGNTDPAGDDITTMDYHGSNRGVKSLMLLNAGLSDNKEFPEGETHLTFDLLNEKFEVPAEKTYYNCRLLKLPEFSEKKHIVKVEPIIQAGNEMLLHHMLVFHCTDDVTETEKVGNNYRCYGSDMPSGFYACSSIIQAWTIGAEAFYFPTHAGYPLGDADAPKYVILETHYDNPETKKGIIDSSGLRFTYTNQLRTHDTGIMEVGHSISGMQHIIPPNADSFLSYADCSSNCLKNAMIQGNVEDINVFGVTLHTHLIGVGIRMRHIRDKTELPYLAKDDSYDFNYQETRTLPEERVIKQSDSLQVVCNYKTNGIRTEFTLGGFDSTKEMCEGFVYYYPKIPTTYCFTAPVKKQLMDYFGIRNVTNPPNDAYADLSSITILEPSEIAGQTVLDYLNSMTWNGETADQLSTALKDMDKEQYCSGSQGTAAGILHTYPAIFIDNTYEEEPLKCIDSSIETTTDLDDEFMTTTGGCNVLQIQTSLYLLTLICTIIIY